jgi:hypothetical protein
MKKCLLFIFFSGSLLLNASCDPDVAGEGIDLPAMKFAFKVSPDTAYIRIGDTLFIHASIGATLSTGLTLTDGSGELWVGMGRGGSIPRTSKDDIYTPYNNQDYKLMVLHGGVKWMSNEPDVLYRFTSYPENDSFSMGYKFIFFKKGLYQLTLDPSFYEGTKGKTRWSGYFDVNDPHWSLVDMPEYPNPLPGEDNYRSSYLLVVTE